MRMYVCLCVRFVLAVMRSSSHALLCRHEERVDVLEALELRLVDLLDHLAAIEPREEEMSGYYFNFFLTLCGFVLMAKNSFFVGTHSSSGVS